MLGEGAKSHHTVGEGPRATIRWGRVQEPPYAVGGAKSRHTLGEGAKSHHTLGEGPRAAIRWGRGLEPPYAGGGA